MKILAIEKDHENVDWSNAKAVLEDEARQVYQFYLDAFIREIYFTESKNAVLILECESKGHAIKLLNTLPLVQNNYISFDCMELRPYTGLDRLIQAK